MKIELDHIVLAAQTLEEGIAFVRERMGVTAVLGGKHTGLGTHNALVPLLRRRYLEIISIDPAPAEPVTQTRWFGLDDPALRASLETGPKFVGYAVRAAEIPADLPGFPALAPKSATRAAFRWTFGFTADGTRPGGGALPYFIAWHAGSAHPCDTLPAPTWNLTAIHIRSPEAAQLRLALAPLGLVEVQASAGEAFALEAECKQNHAERTFGATSTQVFCS